MRPEPVDAPPATPPPPAPRGDRLALAGGLALVAVVAALVELLPPHPWDADTAYHLAVARMMRAHGVLRAFPWTPFSWLADHYADKELLFHALFLPVAGLRYGTASLAVGALAGAIALGALLLVLRAEGVPRAALWAIVPLAGSGAFVMRFACVRPHLLSIALALAIAWAAARRRLAPLAVAAFLYPLAYVGWPIGVGLAVLAEVGRAVSGERPGWRAPAVAALGSALGLLVHPNFPEILRFTWLQDVGILVNTAWARRPDFDLGTEFQPLGPLDAVRHLLVPAALAALAAAVALRRRAARALDPALATFALAAAGFLAATLRTQRFVEYLAPFAAAAGAIALERLGSARRWAAPALVAAVAWTAAFGAAPIRRLATRGDDLPPPVAELARAAIPPGAQVFTCEWGLTGELMLALPERRFLVALDPVLLYAEDPARYDVWRSVVRGGGADAAARIRSTFGAGFAMCADLPSSRRLFRSLAADPTVRVVLAGPLWAVFDLRGGRAPAAGQSATP